ncbi:MAG: TonB-dependent receptor [Gammaproteobacteria bacterium]|nr:TonB-dependent receptor [Gammaproteobacteria bacterium]
MNRLFTGAIALFAVCLAQAETTLEEVVVTAQKREQNLQEVPISVSSLRGKEFSSLFDGGADIRALSTRVPGLYVESSNGRVAPRFYIRGLGNIDFDLAASQPVSVVMDDVVMENVILKSFPIFDIDRVEVSRGPQGSLFGRNTTAGVVKLVSRKPTQQFEAYAEATIGQLGTANFEGAIGGGLSDTISARLSVLVQNRDDYIDNGFTSRSSVLGRIEEQAARLQFLFEPSDKFSALLNVHDRSLDGTATVFRANIFDAGSNELNENFDRDLVFFDQGDDNPQEYDSQGASLNIEYKLDNMTLTSITAMEEADGRSLGDIDGGYGAVFLPEMGPGFIPFPSQTQDSADVEQFTQEFRLSNDPAMHDGFGWQAGLFYFDSDLAVETNPFFIPPTTVNHTNEAWAVFGQVTIPLRENLELIGGLRYTDDEKNLTAPGVNVDLSDEQISGDLTLNWMPTPDSTLYARYANGFKAPTIQGRNIAFPPPSASTARSETSNSFEIGFKQRMFDGRGQVNGAVYHYIVDDKQFTAVGGATNSIQLLNADKGTGTG